MSKVVIKNCEEYELNSMISAIDSALDVLGGWDKFVKAGMKVLLKVNLIGPKSSDTAAVTHCEFVRAITRILKQKGCTVWIGDSSGGAIAGIAPTAQSFIVSGLSKVAQEEGVEIKNFDAGGVVEVNGMYLAKPLFEADAIINLPKLKTHTAGIFTGAVKNVFGCVPGLKKAEYHRIAPNPLDFGNIIVNINKSLKIDLHIMDAVTSMQGEGPTAGEVYHSGKILVSTDPLSLDVVASKMIGMNIDDIPILSAAKDNNIGEWNLDNIKVAGDYTIIPELKNFKMPKRFRSSKKQNYGALIKVIDFLKARPKINTKTCKQCNMCVESCPVQAIEKSTKKIDYSKCIECMCCHELCRYKAVDLKKVNPLANVMTKLYRGNYK